jgi:hypothetical protein
MYTLASMITVRMVRIEGVSIPLRQRAGAGDRRPCFYCPRVKLLVRRR